ncbi:MAG TPA: type II toxin-antitoxin system VapC family toxin [Thermoanaerobaculia bacterium]|jgi:predicted nucleic acid-binding protein|nr:type II toxin-antitoxin system VapC family toxin [Thermoanaerobaculia bacterium]
MVFLLDSNIYIAGFNDPEFGESFRAFHQKNLPRLILSAVVAHELLVGARDRRRIDALERGLIEPFRTRSRIHVPTLATWALAAAIDRGLRELGSYDGSLAQRSFANDILIAATARELGAVLVTRNLRDFELIRRVVPMHFQPPWPAAG